MEYFVLAICTNDGEQIPIKVESDGHTLTIRPDGYEGAVPGSPVLTLKWDHEELQVLVNSEILRDEPTDVINLSRARVVFRDAEVAEIIRQLRTEQMNPFDEGDRYHLLTQRVNAATGKPFNLKEIAALVGLRYSHVRNRHALVCPYSTLPPK